MAIKSTIFKIDLQITDLDRNYYQTHALTIARHPSETDERMIVRVIAFALHAHASLEFGKGLSAEDEPDLWRRDLTGTIEQWIEVGLPDGHSDFAKTKDKNSITAPQAPLYRLRNFRTHKPGGWTFTFLKNFSSSTPA